MAKSSTIGIGIDYSTSCKTALKWAIDHLIDSGDTIVLLIVLSSKSDSVDSAGSLEFNDIHVCRKYGVTLDSELFNVLELVSTAKKANVVAKIYWGDPKEKLCEAVIHLKLDAIVIGGRGQCESTTTIRALLGSTSSHVVRDARCPVTVVK
ncbi:universal stress protein PHOS32-like [Bidens hawaiensis]|uniref:universal stress protein PHOS32-like n=1 Tax=Bidens hawaiensis TaxID=980011 RepID=UPI00404B4950